MRSTLHHTLLTLALLSGSAYAAQPAATAPVSDVQAAQQAIAAFAASLQGELKQAIAAGGPVRAVEVCHTQAQKLAAEASAQHGLQISRVSTRNRNPNNAPNEWQATVLASFEARKAAGEPVAQLSYSETVTTAAGSQVRFMKAIPTAELCVVCHGAVIAPELEARLKQLYPADKARGFNVGDIRGAFVVTRP